MLNPILLLIIAAGVLAWVLRPGKSTTNPRKFAILATAIPPVVVAIAAAQCGWKDVGIGHIKHLLYCRPRSNKCSDFGLHKLDQ